MPTTLFAHHAICSRITSTNSHLRTHLRTFMKMHTTLFAATDMIQRCAYLAIPNESANSQIWFAESADMIRWIRRYERIHRYDSLIHPESQSASRVQQSCRIRKYHSRMCRCDSLNSKIWANSTWLSHANRDCDSEWINESYLQCADINSHGFIRSHRHQFI